MSVQHPDVCSGGTCAIVCDNNGSAFISFEKKCQTHAAMRINDDELNHLIRTDAMRWAVCVAVMAQDFPDVVAGLSCKPDRSLNLEIISAKDIGLAASIQNAVAARMAVYDPLVKHTLAEVLPPFACVV